MRVLILSPVFPLPLTTGTKVRLYHIIRQLRSRGHEVGLVSFIYRSELCLADTIRDWFCELHLLPVRGPGDPAFAAQRPVRHRIEQAAAVARRMLAGDPPTVALAYHPWIAGRLESCAARYDAVFVEFFFMAQNVSPGLMARMGRRMLLVEHDISFIPRMRHARVAGGMRRIFRQLSAIAWRRSEIAALRRFERIVAMSEHDRGLLERLVPGRDILVVPNGVDTAAADPVWHGAPPGPPRLLFVGGLVHEPNYDAVAFFLRDMFPLLARRFPGITFTVAGETAGREQGLPRPAGVAFAGFVPDLAGLYRASTALVVPLRIAGGTRLKIPEAMARGLPVISTAIGAEGLGLEHGRHCLIADTPGQMAEAVGRIAEDRRLAERLSRQGRLVCQERFDWSHIVAAMECDLP